MKTKKMISRREDTLNDWLLHNILCVTSPPATKLNLCSGILPLIPKGSVMGGKKANANFLVLLEAIQATKSHQTIAPAKVSKANMAV